MDSLKRILSEWWAKLRRLPLTPILAGALAALIVALCITIHMRSNIQSRYSQAQAQIQEQTFQHMISMTSLFSRIDDPTVDVQHKLIPGLRAEYSAVEALNTALTEGFGSRSAVLSAELTSAFSAAFEEYSNAYREGRATGLAQDDMAACINEIQLMIDERYAPEEEEEEPVLVIGATAAPTN